MTAVVTTDPIDDGAFDTSLLRGILAKMISQVATLAALTMAHTAPSVTNASGTALAANASRKYALFQNTSTTINIGINLAGGTASATTGIVLMPGQSYEMSAANGNLTTGLVTCCAASGTPSLLVTEGA